MGERNYVRAPYNFVPFSNKVQRPYAQIEDLPAHDELCPELKTGEIHITMTAETPVFVSDGDRNDPHFFRGANREFMIPGSTVRGMVRENMQILGYGVVRRTEDLKDVQIYYREMTAARDSTGDPLKQYYKDALDIATKRSESGKAYSLPRNVRAGYLYKRNGSYWIRPTAGNYFRVSRELPDAKALGVAFATTRQVAYSANGDQVKHICPVEKAEPEMHRGVLLYTGKAVGKPNHLYLFPEADSDAEEIPVSKADEISYAADWEGRHNNLRGGGYDVDFWALPKNGEEKPVFFLRHEGHTYFGMSLFLRIGYRHPLSAGLPDKQKKLLEEDPRLLDYPYGILGFAQESDFSYRSRVSFGDLAVCGKVTEQDPIKTILGDPKPSYYPGYVKNGGTYNDGDIGQPEFQLRGYKQYWLKEAEPADPNGKDKVASILRPLPKGTVFQGVIRYKNLSVEELGLLLWSLRLDEGCYQTIGMGKPYGFGRMKLTIDSLRLFDLRALYEPEGLCASGNVVKSESVDRCIDAYTAAAAKLLKLKKPIRELEELQEFFFMKSALRPSAEISYMDLSEYKNTRAPLPDVKAFMEKAKEEAEEQRMRQPQDMDAMKAALQAKFSSSHKKGR